MKPGIYSAVTEETASRSFRRLSFSFFRCCFLISISFNICFSGLTVSGSSRLKRLK